MTAYRTIIRYGLGVLLIASAFGISGAVSRVSAQNSGRDPFKKYEAPRIVSKKAGGLVTPPTIEQRIAAYRVQKVAAINARMPIAKPTTAFLLSEIQVIGISRSPRGYAAIVEAIPIKLSYVIYPGERFYDGQLVAVEDNRLLFRHETVFSDGRREHSPETKPLRQLSLGDAFTAPHATLPETDKEKAPETGKP